ncbi:hypothetical protein [Nocardioides hwasunensis]|uniref:MFS transporter n=1 Tax=Nocardioides hwasunensis TaxID=397258 RepID=A0ABR8MAQ5_9ACTN|nr:hypothetical protein [Nocardioides hwasunensis]MBD3913235.1 hypothetical protein [Nocardioides hwasunensis]
MRHLIAIVVRLAVLGLALTAYTWLVVPLTSASGDASIGAGLLAFAALFVVGFVGALVDARREGARTAAGWWVAVAAGLAVGWWIALAVPRDSSMSFGELLVADVGTVPFTFGLVAFPAVAGAMLGQGLRRD